MERLIRIDQNKVVSVIHSSEPVSGHVPCPENLAGFTDTELLMQRHLSVLPKVEGLSVAYISVYGIACGISTYSGFLLEHLTPMVGRLQVFPEGELWKRGEPLTRLAEAVHAFKPDVVIIQHEFGIFPSARHWLSLLSQLSVYKTFVVFHSVYDHQDKTVCEAAAKNIIVHSERAREALVSKGVSADISVIPHGCFTPRGLKRLWNIYNTKHTFMQFGFGFEYKGWENSLKACAILKEKYPDVFFTGLFSESKHAQVTHQKVFEKLQNFVTELGIQDHCAILRGYKSEEELSSYFRTNRVAVFPYKDQGEHTVYGVTGAARIAMSYEVPVVTSSVPLFFDLKDATLRADTPEELAACIEQGWANAAKLVEKQNKFLVDNSWKNVAEMYLQVIAKK